MIGQRTGSNVSPLGFHILALIRGAEQFEARARVRIAEGDTLLIEGKVENLMQVEKAEGIAIKAKLALEQLDLAQANLKIVEALVAPQSELIGANLKAAGFRSRYALSVLAIHRHGQALGGKIGDVRLRLGDVLLIEGPEGRVQMLGRGAGLLILDEHQRRESAIRKGLYAAGVFALAVIAGGLGWVPLSVAFLGAALVMILMRCIPIEKARALIDLRLLLLIGGMTHSASRWKMRGRRPARALDRRRPLPPRRDRRNGRLFRRDHSPHPADVQRGRGARCSAGRASAARELGVQERTFAIAIMLAASISFIAPFEPACILVYGPGRYRFVDFLKVGGGLTILLATIVLLLVPVFWPLYPR